MAGVFFRDDLVYLETKDGLRFVYNERRAPLGSGAMGDVYEGYRYQTKDRVAIKKVKDCYANRPEIRYRAKTEASLMFRHHNLIEMLGYCELDDGYGPLYIISNFVQGTNIDVFVNKYIKRDKNFTKKVCELILPIFDALTYIHANKIWHLDIKPSNIMVENGCNVRLMDLGIVQVEESSHSSKAGLMGTPGYAAPEQFTMGENDESKIDARTDLYEMAVTIYVLLTGQNPYIASSIETMKKRHQTMSLPNNAIIPSAVMKVLQKATAPVSSARYSSASEMKLALKMAIANPAPNYLPVVLFCCVALLLVISLIVIIMLNILS